MSARARKQQVQKLDSPERDIDIVGEDVQAVVTTATVIHNTTRVNRRKATSLANSNAQVYVVSACSSQPKLHSALGESEVLLWSGGVHSLLHAAAATNTNGRKLKLQQTENKPPQTSVTENELRTEAEQHGQQQQQQQQQQAGSAGTAGTDTQTYVLEQPLYSSSHGHSNSNSMDQYPGTPVQTPMLAPLQSGNFVYNPSEPPSYGTYYQQYTPSALDGGGHGGTYLLDAARHQSPGLDNLDDDIQWLLANYETAEGVSLPRCTLYNHYLRHCHDNRLDPVNAASFGKLIRSVFLGLRTRRLGTRGNSKYHYYGIRIKPDSPLNRVTEEFVVGNQSMAIRQTPARRSAQPLPKPPQQPYVSPNSVAPAAQPQQQQPTSFQPRSSSAASNASSVTPGASYPPAATSVTGSVLEPHEHAEHLGHAQVPDVEIADDGVSLEQQLRPMGLNIQHVQKFVRAYKQHCDDIADLVRCLSLAEVEGCWRNFWQPEGDGDDDEGISMSANSELSQTQLFSLCTVSAIQHYISNMDYQFYQALTDILMPNVLKSIPSELIQIIRNFAKCLEQWLSVAMQGAPDSIQKIKLSAVKSLAQTLRRYTSLNHLAQAARHVLETPTQISQMLTDLNRVDFHNVQEQASWVCHCDNAIVENLERSFKENLAKPDTMSLEEWAQWLVAVVDQVMAPFHDQPIEKVAAAAKKFLLKWSFYSSMIIRDLTLRSAHSFGSFHLIRLLYDEYMFYLIEQRLAKATGQTSIYVMATQDQNLLDSIMAGVGIGPQQQPAQAADGCEQHSGLFDDACSSGPVPAFVLPLSSASSAYFSQHNAEPSASGASVYTLVGGSLPDQAALYNGHIKCELPNGRHSNENNTAGEPSTKKQKLVN